MINGRDVMIIKKDSSIVSEILDGQTSVNTQTIDIDGDADESEIITL
ncbi:MAG: hypothetical protein K0U47_04585 [Epsilonproteobacteria bacterium]|nr:hypothetical protein [Campylobacterota bacterium]